MYERRAFLAVEIGNVVTAWFQTFAGLTPSEADEVIRNLVTHAERERDLAKRN